MDGGPRIRESMIRKNLILVEGYFEIKLSRY